MRRSPVGVRVQLAILGVTLAAGLAGAGKVLAQVESPGPADTVDPALAVEFVPSKGQGIPSYIAARLTRPDGSSVTDASVRFYRMADIFGGRKVELGRSKTDGAGMARVPVVPRTNTYDVIVSFAGDESLGGITWAGEMTFPEDAVVRSARPPHGGGLVDPHLRPLADVMPGVIGTVVLVVWIVLVLVALSVLWRVRRDGARDGSLASRRGLVPETASSTDAAAVDGASSPDIPEGRSS